VSREEQPCDARHVLWVYNASPTVALGVTTRLAVTRELRKLGWRVTLLLEGPTGHHNVGGVEVLCIPKPQVYLLGYCMFHIRLLRLIAEHWTTVDVVLFHQMSAPWLLPLRLVRRLLGRERPLLVMDTRDLNPIGHGLRFRLRIAFYNLVHRLANRWADGQTAITPRMAELVQVPPSGLWGTWPSGVDTERFRTVQDSRKWPAAEGPVHLAYIGALFRERNLLPLCRAVEQANAEGMKFVLSIVGRGPERSTLDTFASRTRGTVRVSPPLPHDQIPQRLGQAHVGVSLLDLDVERFQGSSPIKVFEYMGAGLPLLCTPNHCHTEVIRNGPYAFWAEDVSEELLLAALHRLWDARAFLRKMGEEASKEAQSWTWQEAARKLKIALERGCGEHRTED
jgi:glycosyltransferase involved in cell wall biosynthesis